MSKKQGFMVGAMILSLSGFLVKLIGAVFKIPLTNLVGTEAMGYFNSAYSIYVFLLSLATSGIPTGIAAMVSRSIALRQFRDVKNMVRMAFVLFVIFGLVISGAGILFAPQLAELMNSADAYYCVVSIMPAIFFMSIVSVFRGFFQGHNNMTPTAISNIIEAVVKMAAGLGIAYFLSWKGYPPAQVVGGAISGITLGTALSALFMVFRYLFRSETYRLSLGEFVRETPTPKKKLLQQFFLIAFPVMISSVTSNLMSAVDAFFVVNRMKTYLGVEMANFNWGCYGSMALTIFNLPSFLIIAIGTSLVPSISSAFALRQQRQIRSSLDTAIKFSSILAFGCAFGLNAVAENSLYLFYPRLPESVQVATPLLEIVSFALISVGLTNVTASILQAVGKAYLSVVSVAVGAAIKTVFTYVLVGIPELNIHGAPIATNIAYPVMLILNLLFIRKYLHYSPKWGQVLFKPLVAALGCFGAVKGFTALFPSLSAARFGVCPLILVGGIVYVVLLFFLKCINICEIRKIFRKN